MRVVVNPLAERGPRAPEETSATCRSKAEAARREIAQWPGYVVTPLLELDDLAAELGLGKVLFKDESQRLGLGSFKSLGGAYAAELMLQRHRGDAPVTLVCATDGNHGQSVAFAARRNGCAAVIYMHSDAPEHKARAIRELGATVIRWPGSYDDSVREAARAAAANGWLLVADTGTPDDPAVKHVMQGYGVLALEILEQLSATDLPTHVFIQAGVGGLAAGVAGIFSEVFGRNRPVFVGVEPETAACLMESAVCGAPVRIGGDLRTSMHMLSAGETSLAAWPILQRRFDAFVAIDDSLAEHMALRLSRPDGVRPAMSTSPTGAAGLAGLAALMSDRRFAEVLGLGPHARVLVFGTEGAEPRATQTPAAARGLALCDIESTRTLLRPHIAQTPIHRWQGLEIAERGPTDAEVLLKLELFQHTGTFKARGALSVVLRLTPDQIARGVTAVSAGNHAIATAYAAQKVGATAKVVMLASANPERVRQCRGYGAEIVMAPDGKTAFELAGEIERAEGRVFVHPFEGPLTSLGTASLGAEWLEQAGRLDAVIVPVGGGGLCSGVAAAVKLLQPDCLVFGVEPEGADTMHRSLAAGQPVARADVATIADSLAPPYVLPFSFALCRDNVDAMVRISDDQIRDAMGVLFREMKLAVEPAGAAATAALFGPLRARLAGKRVGVLVCGANIDGATFAHHLGHQSGTGALQLGLTAAVTSSRVVAHGE